MLRMPLSVSAAVLFVCGCSTFSHTNVGLGGTPPGGVMPDADVRMRATFDVDGKRGNKNVLFFLALSGGGSRAAYLSGMTMLKLQTVFDDVDLLREVDVVSSVSGGSLPAAYYAVTRDEREPLAGPLRPLRDLGSGTLPSPKLEVDLAGGTLRCSARLDGAEERALRALPGLGEAGAERVVELCAQAARGHLRTWNRATVRDLMARNYLWRWVGNWFWPDNILLYWFTAYDRSDIMAKTFEDNMYDTPVLGVPHTFAHLNPQRPYLIINSTNASEPPPAEDPEPYAFGSVFTFTEQDFRDRLDSEIMDYSVARAVMASSAFPLVFANMTLRDFRKKTDAYLHVFDGGNSDNLGLKSVKRALFELALAGKLDDYASIVVLQVDAFTLPGGTSRTQADPRSPLSLVADTNLLDAVDSLLQANRAKLVGEMRSGQLRWNEGDCERESYNLPRRLCERLDARYGRNGEVDVHSKLVFYHFGFDDVEPLDAGLKAKLDRIPTSFRLSGAHAALIDDAVDRVLTPDNPCLRLIRAVVAGAGRDAALADACRGYDRVPQPPKGK